MLSVRKGASRIYPVKKIRRYKSPRIIIMKNGLEMLNNIVYKAIRANDYFYNPITAVISHRMFSNGKRSKQQYGE